MESSEPSESASLVDAARRSSVPDVPLHQTDLEAGQPASGFPASDATALDNARRGTWVINDYLDGWMLLGANGRPVTRADGSRVAFWFRDADRLAQELTTAEGGEASAAKKPVGLASLESGFDRDWDPETRRAYFADVTKAAQLLAYHYVQTTEPEEAVRRAIATVLGDPVTVREGQINAFVPKRYNLTAVKVANALRDELVGPDHAEMEIAGPSAPLDAAASEKSNEPDVGGQPSKIFPAFTRLLEPIARIGLAQADQWDAIRSGSFEADRLLAPVETVRNIAGEILNDPYASDILAGIGAIRGRTPRISTRKLTKTWETVKGRTWPMDPETGRNMIASHKKALGDRGTNNVRNIEPLTRREHIERHRAAGDFARWAKRRGNLKGDK